MLENYSKDLSAFETITFFAHRLCSQADFAGELRMVLDELERSRCDDSVQTWMRTSVEQILEREASLFLDLGGLFVRGIDVVASRA